MAKVYAVEEGTGRRFLVRLECDACDATIKPHPEISSSGWMKRVQIEPPGGPGSARFEWHYCPDHAHYA